MDIDLGTHLAYNDTQWSNTFYNFPIEQCKLKNGQGFYHYTSLSNALKILNLIPEKDSLANNRKNYISLYASHFLFLNDATELFDSLNRVINVLQGKCNSLCSSSKDIVEAKSVLEEYIKIFSNIKPNQIKNAPNHFIICFCLEGNLLTQWEYYGKECGIAIEFNLEDCVYDGLSVFNKHKTNAPLKVIPRKIIYNDKEKEIILDKLKKYKVKDTNDALSLAMRSIASASFMKHPSFSAEKEVRLLFSPIIFTGIDSYSDIFQMIEYRDSGGIIKPYMEIHMKCNNDKMPIKSVTVGPGNNQQLVFNGMIKLIQSKFQSKSLTIPDIIERRDEFLEVVEVGNIEVRRSTIPFRR